MLQGKQCKHERQAMESTHDGRRSLAVHSVDGDDDVDENFVKSLAVGRHGTTWRSGC